MSLPAAGRRSGLLAGVQRLLERRLDHDGEAPALERLAGQPPTDGEETSRRDRRPGLPHESLDRSLALKVLHGWLQNRNQVLVPLTLRLGRLAPEDAATVMRFTAVVVLDATDAGPAARGSAERWLREIGASADGLAPFHEALDHPPGLSRLMVLLRERDLGPYGYAAAVAAVDTRDRTARLFANYVAARLALPADAVRSIDRRARR